MITRYVAPHGRYGRLLCGISTTVVLLAALVEPASAVDAQISTADTFTRYVLPADTDPDSLLVRPDGTIWFTNRKHGNDVIVRLSRSGKISEYAISSHPNRPSGLGGLINGPDGAIWFYEQFKGKIGRINASGVITEYTAPNGSLVYATVNGRDGGVWFSGWIGDAFGHGKALLGRVSASGVFSEYRVIPSPADVPRSMVVGPDGAIWFVEYSSNGSRVIWRASNSGEIRKFTIPGETGGPGALATGSDGALWSIDYHKTLGRLSTTGTYRAHLLTDGALLRDITSAADGTVWVVETKYASNNGYKGGKEDSKVARVTPAGTLEEFPLPPNRRVRLLTTDTKGGVWYVDGNSIVCLSPPYFNLKSAVSK